MTPDRRAIVVVLAPGLALAVVGLLLAGLFAATLAPAERAAMGALLAPRAALVLLAWAVLAIVLGALARRADARWPGAVARLAETTQTLIAGGAPRPVPASAHRRMRLLHEAINELARQRDDLHADIDAQVRQAAHDIEQERSRLAALMSELTHSVVVCNLDGRIVLYNHRARRQFRALSHASEGTAEPIGLGRSVYAVLDRKLVAHALESLQRRLRRGMAQPWAQLVTSTRAGQLLRVRIAPVREASSIPDEPPQLSGFVLTLHDVTRESEQDAEPDRRRSEGMFYDFDLFARTAQAPELDDRRLADLTYTVFDTETTGLDPTHGDEIIEIGAVRIVNRRLLRHEAFEQLIDPGRDLPPPGIAIHGITPAMLVGQPVIASVLPAFRAYVGDTVLVAHNAAFDMRFLALKEAGTGVRFEQPVLDTLLLSAVVHPHQASHELVAIADRFGIPVADRHRALGDAIVTAEVFLRLLPLLAARGIHTLRDAREAARHTRYARVAY